MRSPEIVVSQATGEDQTKIRRWQGRNHAHERLCNRLLILELSVRRQVLSRKESADNKHKIKMAGRQLEDLRQTASLPSAWLSKKTTSGCARLRRRGSKVKRRPRSMAVLAANADRPSIREHNHPDIAMVSVSEHPKTMVPVRAR